MKPEFVKYLHADSILVLEGETKKAVLEEIITYATTRCTMDEAQLREAIWKREKMMTTGIGNGLALPHIRADINFIPQETGYLQYTCYKLIHEEDDCRL